MTALFGDSGTGGKGNSDWVKTKCLCGKELVCAKFEIQHHPC